MLHKYILAILLAIACSSNAQDDPCKFVKLTNGLDNCDYSDTSRIKTHARKWKRNFDNEWQILCFTPEQLRQTMNSQISCQGNSSINESFLRKGKSTLLEISVIDDTQILWIPDSIFKPKQDLLRTKIGISKSDKTKSVSPAINIGLETQKFNGFQTITDSLGLPFKQLSSSFLSPGTALFQSGIKFTINPENVLDLGIGTIRYKWLSSKELRMLTKSNKIDKHTGKEYNKFEGGLSLNGTFESTFKKTFLLAQSCRLFYPISKPRSIEFEMKNKLSIKLAKHLKTSLLTIYTYSESNWPPSFWRAELRLGYFINN